VLGILEDRKTQTRRVIKPQPEENYLDGFRLQRGIDTIDLIYYPGGRSWAKIIKCPYGKRGTRLWCRETFTEIVHGEKVIYRADLNKYSETIQWTSPIFMPRWASRITLEIVNVRVERIQSISEADAFAEGISGGDWLGDPVGEFAKLWNSINGKRGFGWDLNPYVWVLEFKRIKL
jgi:hypothetical protein